MMDLARHRLKTRLETELHKNAWVVLTGPRQCGKTTLALDLAEQMPATYFDLDTPSAARQLENPGLVLDSLTGLLIFDHVQVADPVWHLLQVFVQQIMAEGKLNSRRFLVIGSNAQPWGKNLSESHGSSLVMGGFEAQEVGMDRWKKLWLRGRFPSSFLADSDSASMRWRHDFIRQILERDLHFQGVHVLPQVLRRLLQMLVHQNGQVVNTSELGRSLGEAHTTVKRHLEILEAAGLIRQLQPWQADISKRQVKFPKIYIRDSGLAHALLGLETHADLQGHPVLAASWEGFCIEHILAWVEMSQGHLESLQTGFWGTHGHAELDLIIVHQGRRLGFDFKFSDAPRMTRAMRIAHEDLQLEKLFVVYPGVGNRGSYALNDWAEVIAFKEAKEKFESRLQHPAPEPVLASPGSKMGFAKFF